MPEKTILEAIPGGFKTTDISGISLWTQGLEYNLGLGLVTKVQRGKEDRILRGLAHTDYDEKEGRDSQYMIRKLELFIEEMRGNGADFTRMLPFLTVPVFNLGNGTYGNPLEPIVLDFLNDSGIKVREEWIDREAKYIPIGAKKKFKRNSRCLFKRNGRPFRQRIYSLLWSQKKYDKQQKN